MKWLVSAGDLLGAAADALVVPVREGDDPGPVAQTVDAAAHGRLLAWMRETGFRAKPSAVRTLHTFGAGPARFLTVVGEGGGDDPLDRLRHLAARAARSARDAGATTLALALDGLAPVDRAARAVVEGVAQSTYRFTDLKSESSAERRLTEVHLLVPEGQEATAQAGVDAGAAVAAGLRLARDLVNQPGGQLWPERLASITAAMATEAGLACRVYDGEELATMGAGALIGVGRGSDRPPCLIHLRYRPDGQADGPPIAFVGKGITFDTGGYNLKPGAGMETMKVDMAGAAAVVGAMRALAALRPPLAVDAVIACAENMVSGRSMRPGDVLRAMNGTTIEVNNTDAEGRLVLADAITFAVRQGACEVVDLATLTGACVVALGTVCTGVMGAPQSAVAGLLAAAAQAGERMWQLPLYDEYREALRSDVADLRNSGGRNAGAQVGAAFIREFAGKTPWVHLDIAGTAWSDKASATTDKGATGVGVRTLIALAEMRAQQATS